MVVLDDAAQSAQAVKVIQGVDGVCHVDACKGGTCTVTADIGHAKAVADALKAAGIKASVWVKQA